MKTTPRAFTLIELLTVIAIIGILAAIIIPTVGSVRKAAQKAKCVSNLRQIGVSLIGYANNNKQQLPRLSGGTLAWDVQRSVIIELMGQAGRDVMYCPSGQQDNRTMMWEAWNPHAATQYVLLLQSSPLTAPGGVYRGIPEAYMNQSLRDTYTVDGVAVPNSRRELAADSAVRLGDNYLWASTLSGNRSNHLSGGSLEGINVLYLDGHVKWRPFAEIQWRTASTPQFGW